MAMNAGQPNPALSFKALALSLKSRVAEVEKGWLEGKPFPKHLWQTYNRVICDGLVLFLANCSNGSRSARNTEFADLYDQFVAKFPGMTYACSRQNGFTYLARELLRSCSDCVEQLSAPISNLVLGHHPHLLEVYTSRCLAPIANWFDRIFPQQRERDHTVPIYMNIQPDNRHSPVPDSWSPLLRAPTGGIQFQRASDIPAVQQLDSQPIGFRQPFPRAPTHYGEYARNTDRLRHQPSRANRIPVVDITPATPPVQDLLDIFDSVTAGALANQFEHFEAAASTDEAVLADVLVAIDVVMNQLLGRLTPGWRQWYDHFVTSDYEFRGLQAQQRATERYRLWRGFWERMCPLVQTYQRANLAEPPSTGIVGSEDGFHRVRSRGREQSGIFNSTFRFDSAVTRSFRGLQALISENGSHLNGVITFFRITLDPISALTAFPRELRTYYNEFLGRLGISPEQDYRVFVEFFQRLEPYLEQDDVAALNPHPRGSSSQQIQASPIVRGEVTTPRHGTRGRGMHRGQSRAEQVQQPRQHAQNIWTPQLHAAHEPHNGHTHFDPTHFERSDFTPASGFTQTSGNQMRFSNIPSTSQARQPRISDILNFNDRPTPFQPAADFSSTSSELESLRDDSHDTRGPGPDADSIEPPIPRTREPFPVIPVPIPVSASSPQGVPGQQHRGSPIRRAAEAAEHRHQQNMRAQGNRSQGATSDTISRRGGNRNAILPHHVIPSTSVSAQCGGVHTGRRKTERSQNCTAAQNVADRDGSCEDERPPEEKRQDSRGHGPHPHSDGDTCRQARQRPGLEFGGREAHDGHDGDGEGGGSGGGGGGVGSEGIFVPSNDDYICYPPEPDLFPPVIDLPSQQLPVHFPMHPMNPSQPSFPAKIHPSLVHNPRGFTNPVGLRWDIIQDPYHASFRSRYGTILSVGLDDIALDVDPGRNVNVFPGRLPYKIWIEADPLYSSNPCLSWWMDLARWGPIIIQRQYKVTLRDILQGVHDYFYTQLSFADFQACTGTQTGTEYSNMDRLVAARRQRGLRTELTSVVDAEDIHAFSNYRRSDVLGTYLTFHGMRVDVRRDGSWVLLMSLGPSGPQKYYD
ncbi:hypothetical protein PM082_009907 [Marasmius tenuissimus]|nr:hypothetical protein PM082_009907 [Marasmius tenuissimus]